VQLAKCGNSITSESKKVAGRDAQPHCEADGGFLGGKAPLGKEAQNDDQGLH
jgi:hypothetical protein